MNNSLPTQLEVNNNFLYACENGKLVLVKLNLTQEPRADIHFKKDKGFLSACENGHFDIVQYLTHSHDITEHSQANCQNSKGLLLACQNAHFDIVQYLTSSNLLKVHANLKKVGDTALQLIFYKMGYVNDKSGHVNDYDKIINFLISSSELKNKPTIDGNHHNLFKNAFVSLCVEKNSFLIEKLLYQYQLNCNKDVLDIAYNISKQYRCQHVYEQFLHIVEKQKLYHDLNNQLVEEKETIKKNKI